MDFGTLISSSKRKVVQNQVFKFSFKWIILNKIPWNTVFWQFHLFSPMFRWVTYRHTFDVTEIIDVALGHVTPVQTLASVNHRGKFRRTRHHQKAIKIIIIWKTVSIKIVFFAYVDLRRACADAGYKKEIEWGVCSVVLCVTAAPPHTPLTISSAETRNNYHCHYKYTPLPKQTPVSQLMSPDKTRCELE